MEQILCHSKGIFGILIAGMNLSVGSVDPVGTGRILEKLTCACGLF